MLNDVRVIVWDLDGTLYQTNPRLQDELYKVFVHILSQHKNITPGAAELLLSETRKIHKGITKSLTALGCGDSLSIIDRVEKLIDKTSYLHIDPKLQALFMHLSDFRHVVISDTFHKTIVTTLAALGLSHTLFSHIVGVDDVHGVKPDLLMFRTILQLTGLVARAHLMVGDRVEVDLVPAKVLGMKTVLVWDEKKYSSVDFSLSTVYDVAELFLQKPDK